MIYACLATAVVACCFVCLWSRERAALAALTSDVALATRSTTRTIQEVAAQVRAFDTLRRSGHDKWPAFFAQAPDDLLQEIALVMAAYASRQTGRLEALVASKREYLDGMLAEDEMIQRLSDAQEAVIYCGGDVATAVDIQDQVVLNGVALNGVSAVAATVSKLQTFWESQP